MSELKQRETLLLEELETCSDWKERYSYILDLGDELSEMPVELKVDATKVQGCVSQVWLFSQLKDGKMIYLCDSDSLFVKGLVAVLIKLYSNLTVEEVLSSDGNFLMTSGLVENLSPNRVNGAAAILQRIQDDARKHGS